MSIDLIKENGRQYPVETMTNADYTDNLVLLTNTPAQAESLLDSLEQPVGGIGLFMNANKIEFMSFEQDGATSILTGKTLKLVN